MANYVVNQALAATTSALSSIVTYLGLGTGTTDPAKTDTSIEGEITDSGLAKGAATVAQATTTSTNDTLSLSKTWTVSGSKAIAKIGAIRSDGSSLYAIAKFTSAKNVTAGDSFTGTLSIILTN
jgi:hypothetical protein